MHTVSLQPSGNARHSLALHCFEDFYQKIVQHQQTLVTSTLVDNPSIFHAASNISQTHAQDIQKDLIELLENQAFNATTHDPIFAAHYQQSFLYIMVTLADEIFLNIDWSGKVFWENNLLESRFFGTHDAGDVFFKKLDAFLGKWDVMQSDVAEFYLLALGLDFQGKYRNTLHGPQSLQDLREKLYVLMSGGPVDVHFTQVPLCSDAYDHTLHREHCDVYNQQKSWGIIFGSVSVLCLLFTHILWRHATYPVYDIINRLTQEALIYQKAIQ